MSAVHIRNVSETFCIISWLETGYKTCSMYTVKKWQSVFAHSCKRSSASEIDQSDPLKSKKINK